MGGISPRRRANAYLPHVANSRPLAYKAVTVCIAKRQTMARLSVVLLALLLAACNLNVPEVTPTVAPSRTPSLTPIVTSTQTPSQTPTRTPDATEIALLFTPTDTAIPSATQTAL